MPQQVVNLGSAANDKTGDTLRVGGDKINDNFAELYQRVQGILDAGGIGDIGNLLSESDIDTLAKLNAILTDADLIRDTDSRLSDARTPTSHGHTTGDISGFDAAVSSNAQVTANSNKNSYPAADQIKLAGIEANAKDDQTGAEIKAAYEAEANTNAFTDAEKSKLSGVETGATADQTGAEIKAAYESQSNTNAYTDSEKSKVANVPADTNSQLEGITHITATNDYGNQTGNFSVLVSNGYRQQAALTGAADIAITAPVLDDVKNRVALFLDISAYTGALSFTGVDSWQDPTGAAPDPTGRDKIHIEFIKVGSQIYGYDFGGV